MRLRASRSLLVLPMLLGLAVTGCAGTDQDGEQVATAGGGAAASPSATVAQVSDEDRQREFAKCMRENGMPDFPDPEPGEGGKFRVKIPAGQDREKAQAAMEKCRSLMPNGGKPVKLDPEQVEMVRQLAKCMRENGVPNFPDPGPDGALELTGDAGFDPESPSVQAAMEKCRKDGGAPMIMKRTQ
ncbi:hypothetical protein [Micromonospora eburnea]|uniref:Secreted protein n=1 Tax=Micromonospora eburnea TaxID=227316 RepID=A0A1C6TV29_9ACTN|nr:hypothetical protein [Micromonospora eburnea]SCL45635.1 hypothetical protein GA0070604_1048 [Micromonospora eburnea]